MVNKKEKKKEIFEETMDLEGETNIKSPKWLKEDDPRSWSALGQEEIIEQLNYILRDLNSKSPTEWIETGNTRVTLDIDKETKFVELQVWERKRAWHGILKRRK